MAPYTTHVPMKQLDNIKVHVHSILLIMISLIMIPHIITYSDMAQYRIDHNDTSF